jgi:hypothetical protein
VGREYHKAPGYTGWKTRDLLRALGNGAKIVTTDPRWEGREVEYAPREAREQYPWHVKGEATGWVRGTFCKPVTQDGGPWSVGELLRLRMH